MAPASIPDLAVQSQKPSNFFMKKIISILLFLFTAYGVEAATIGEVSTTFKLLSPNDKIVVDVFDDPEVAGVSCYLSHAKTGGYKGKLPEEQQQEVDAKAYMDELQQIVDAFSKQLADFDAVAKKAMQQLASANAQGDLQEMRAQRQSELDGLKSLGGHSTALDALTRRAQAVSNEAAGMKIVADINQKPLDQAAEIAAIRKSVSEPDTAGESTLERLKRLSAKPAA
jgi:hypothetical protein